MEPVVNFLSLHCQIFDIDGSKNTQSGLPAMAQGSLGGKQAANGHAPSPTIKH